MLSLLEYMLNVNSVEAFEIWKTYYYYYYYYYYNNRI